MQHVLGYTGSLWMWPSGNYSLPIVSAAAQATAKETTKNKYTYFAGHSDGHGDAPVCYRAHCLMKEVQYFSRSNWMLPLGKYSL
jgi:hypothetical protein